MQRKTIRFIRMDILISKEGERIIMNSNKVYVDVMAEFSKEGILTPKSFRWIDGVVYEIQRVKDIRRAASLRAGGVGIRYTCIVNGRDSYLFYEDNNLWFMEKAGE